MLVINITLLHYAVLRFFNLLISATQNANYCVCLSMYLFSVMINCCLSRLVNNVGYVWFKDEYISVIIYVSGTSRW